MYVDGLAGAGAEGCCLPPCVCLSPYVEGLVCCSAGGALPGVPLARGRPPERTVRPFSHVSTSVVCQTGPDFSSAATGVDVLLRPQPPNTPNSVTSPPCVA